MYFNLMIIKINRKLLLYVNTPALQVITKGILTFSFDSFSDHNINTYYKLCKQKR